VVVAVAAAVIMVGGGHGGSHGHHGFCGGSSSSNCSSYNLCGELTQLYFNWLLLRPKNNYSSRNNKLVCTILDDCLKPKFNEGSKKKEVSCLLMTALVILKTVII
jgi:hypothetical protein